MLCHVPCLPHVLNNSIKYSLKVEPVKKLVVHAKALCKGFRSGELRNALQHEQKCYQEPNIAPILSNRKIPRLPLQECAQVKEP